MITSIHSLVVAGTAPSGPTNELIPVSVTAPNAGYSLFAARKQEFTSLSPGATGQVFLEPLETLDIRYVYLDGLILKEVALYNITQLGPSEISFDTPAIPTTVSGWFDYQPKELTATLSRNLRQVTAQSAITSPEDGLVHLLRVAGSGSTKAQTTLGPVVMTTVYPSNRHNGWTLEITNTTLEVYADIAVKPLKLWSYSLNQTIGSLVEQITFDYLSANFPFKLDISLPIQTSALELISFAGSAIVSGGVVTNPTAEDYAAVLNELELAYCDVIVLPGVPGREFFPLTQELFNDHIGYPFCFVCPTNDYSTDLSLIGADLWQSDRLHLVAGSTDEGVY